MIVPDGAGDDGAAQLHAVLGIGKAWGGDFSDMAVAGPACIQGALSTAGSRDRHSKR